MWDDEFFSFPRVWDVITETHKQSSTERDMRYVIDDLRPTALAELREGPERGEEDGWK